MARDGILSLTATFNKNGQVTRKFSQSYEHTKFGVAVKEISKKNNQFAKRLARTFEKIHKLDSGQLGVLIAKHIFAEVDNIFVQEKRVQWYLSEFFTKIFKEEGKKTKCFSAYTIRVKACREHYFYTLEAQKKNEKAQLIHVPFFQKVPPPSDATDVERVRGLADTILFLAPNLLKYEEIEELTDFISWFDIQLQCETETVSRNSITLNIKPQIEPTTFTNIDYKNKSIYLPPKHRPILVSSPNVRNALESLSEVWLNPTAKSVLLSASPGSGKEVLVDLLTDVMRIDKIERIDISASAIGEFQRLKNTIVKEGFKEGTEVELQNLPAPLKQKILKWPTKNISYDDRKKHLIYKGPMTNVEMNELLGLSEYRPWQKAIQKLYKTSPKRIILFLDEIHHDAAEDIRSGLLRFMENEKMEEEKLDCKHLLYVLAASLLPHELRTRKPPDLWTRLEYTVKLRHPLRIEDDIERKGILRDYFLLFWENQDRKMWESSGKGYAVDKAIEFLDSDKDFVDKLSNTFKDELGSPLIPFISIRILRSIVKRLFSRTVNYLRRMNPPFTESSEMHDKTLSEFKKWIAEVSIELVPEIDTKGQF